MIKNIVTILDIMLCFIRNNKLGDECANIVRNVLYTNTTLTDLDLSGIIPNIYSTK